MSLFPETSLSVVLPVYNEEALVEAAVRRAIREIDAVVGRFEILLIDDCSTDRTGELADSLGRELSQLRVFHNPRNLRQGGCLAMGFLLARFDLVTHNAIDLPFHFADLAGLLPLAESADVIVATRRTYPGVSAGRRAVSWVNRTLIRLLFGSDVRDFNFVQIYRREALAQLPCFSTATGFMTVERVLRAHHQGFRVIAVDTDYHRREVGGSSSGNLRVIRESLRDMARLRMELWASGVLGRSAAGRKGGLA